MNAKSACSAHPIYAITCWCDATSIYTELPAVNGGQPYIQSWPLTEGGLSKALAQLRDLHRQAEPLGGNYKIPFNPLLRKADINNFSEDQRRSARDVLRKLKIT